VAHVMTKWIMFQESQILLAFAHDKFPFKCIIGLANINFDHSFRDMQLLLYLQTN